MAYGSEEIVRGRDSELNLPRDRRSASKIAVASSLKPPGSGGSSRGILGRVTSGMKNLVMGSESKTKRETSDVRDSLPAVSTGNRDGARRSTSSTASTASTVSRDSVRRSWAGETTVFRARSEELNKDLHLPCPPHGSAAAPSPAVRSSFPREGSCRKLNPRESRSESGSFGRGSSGSSSRATVRPRPFKLGTIYPVIPDRLYFTVHKNDQMTHREARDHPDLIFFSADYQDRYEPFCADFGPVNLGVMHEFFNFMMDKLTQKRFANKKMVYYIDEDEAIRTNAAFLLASFAMVYYQMTPQEAWAPFDAIQPSPWKPFRDATWCPQDYYLGILPCLEGVKKAMECGWYNPKRFDLEDYHYHDHPQNADMHVVSDKFIAFRGPSNTSTMLAPGFWTFTPKHYLSIFKEKKVKGVVRLNEASTYKKDTFEKGGFDHYDLYFDDCTVPNQAVIDRFMSIAESEDGKLAVHCKAGLGRTGTLIALYFMKHHGFTAEECIGWLRVCRPGSIIGPQQHWLHWAEDRLKRGLPLDGADAELTAKKSEILAKQVADGMDRKAAQRAGGRR